MVVESRERERKREKSGGRSYDDRDLPQLQKNIFVFPSIFRE